MSDLDDDVVSDLFDQFESHEDNQFITSKKLGSTDVRVGRYWVITTADFNTIIDESLKAALEDAIAKGWITEDDVEDVES